MAKYDLIVIGAGPGGYPAAIRAAQLGASVALIEKEALGGVCLNWGCIPTKTLISGASLYGQLRQAERFGIQTGKITFDYASMQRNKEAVVAKLQAGLAALIKANGIALHTGRAVFLGRNRLAVHPPQGAPSTLEGARTIIATGAVSFLPSWLPASPRIVDSRAFLDLPQLPRSLIVLGGGVIGTELACLAAQLGVQVTIIELLEDILLTLDTDLRATLRRHMERELKIRILTGTAAKEVLSEADKITLKTAQETFSAELLLVATGRRPQTQALELKQAGVQPDPQGFIAVDESGQTAAATIYAVGDVTGGVQLAHAATAQGIAAAEHALAQRPPARPALVPSCIFTAPEIGTVGLTEKEAQEQQRAVRSGKFPFQALGRALAAGETQGFVKLIVDAKSDQILGAQVIGLQATELIAEATTAIQAELTARELGSTIHAHPTLAEAWMEAARAVHGACIHAAPQRSKHPQ
ncbi:MAG: dihydrolipoyl dehydrogenase [Lentisphaerae bacterium]|nr:dihydrolipoyl dehydrogenase [Lentisphaerota bacterium]